MRLLSVVVSNYRRFAEAQTIYVGARVVAVVGPNEAGKTSLLSALGHLPDDSAFDRRELTDRQYPPARTPIVSARYEVELSDRQTADTLLLSTEAYSFTHVLNSDATIRWEVTPDIRRDVAARAAFSQAAADLNGRGALAVNNGEDSLDVGELAVRADVIAASLSEASEDLSQEELADLQAFEQILTETVDQCADPDAGADLLRRTSQLVTEEALENPRTQLYALLMPRLPQMLLFTEEQRELQSDYVWAGIDTVPPALENLLHLAGCSYGEYRNLAVDRDRRDELSTFERRRNQALNSRLATWSQSRLTVTLRADHESLAIHVTDAATERDVVIGERSAGMRMFVSLLAFCARYGGAIRPILLFDEAETHLHYGAQADLMEVFATQDVAQAVIYTTHSIGCLPEDLGRSIRVVAPIGNERSEIRNEFWTGGVGLTPLMLAMGASAIAFSPARYVLLGEGATEAILLPSLFRAAAGDDVDFALGFQVACGTAEVPAEFASELETEAANVAYVFDADEGGRQHAAKLASHAHHDGRVFVLGAGQESGLCTEDLVAAETYVMAVNSVLRDTRNTAEAFDGSNLPTVARGAHVDAWCRSLGIARLSKARVAERVLRIADGSGLLLEPSRREMVANLRLDVLRALRPVSREL